MTAVPGVGAPQRPLCFVLMPFGAKPDASGGVVDFDTIYTEVIAPAVTAAALEPLRADEERDGGLIHKPMFERLALCSFAVADLTLANANVFYELGVRHAVRPHTTVLLFARGGPRLPFDVSPLRAVPYDVDGAGRVADPTTLAASITRLLRTARDPVADSPVFQLLDGFGPPDLSRLRSDAFRDRVRHAETVKERLRRARRAEDPVAAVSAAHDDLRPIGDQDIGVAVELFLAHRDVGAFATMIDVVDELPALARGTVLVREQLALALNRVGRDVEAEAVLQGLLEERGASSETLGLLGRIHKDRWLTAMAEGSPAAPVHLARAVNAYRRGYEVDWRDLYPGVNAVTLLELQDPGQAEVAELLPVVRYAAHRRSDGRGDYWVHATLLELAVIARNDAATTTAHLRETLAEHSEPWMRHSTVRNLQLVADQRGAAGEDIELLRRCIELLHPPDGRNDGP